MRNDNGPLPMLIAAAAILLLSIMDAAIKGLTSEYGTLQIVLMRYVGGAVFAFAVAAAVRVPIPGWASIRANAVRAAFMVMTALSFFYAVSVLPLAEAVALSFMAPLFMAFIARSVLGEAIRASVLTAILVGLAGVGVILNGKISLGVLDARTMSGIIAALICAVTYATAMVLVRKQTATDPIETITFLSAAIGSLILLPIIAVMWLIGPSIGIPAREIAFVTPRAGDLPLIIGLGLLGTAGHLLLTFAYARAHAARLGVLEYTAFLWAGLLGFIAFGEMPTLWTLVGAGLIIAGCLLAARPARARQVATT